ncbi:Oxaloacetate decarboxylase [Candidatus Johnevansia muelleri]|uniref:Oxaloacetate decarboxylase n=1 Tax=Candidatus Johnevansia muelleri TaxID=1495769 RepID=A0A078KEA5_9GAMM|nr:Oxaloacetate decarboxylase [Candidatus Evansia muelleri]
MVINLSNKLRKKFRKLLQSESCYDAASIFDPISSRMAFDLGFEVGIIGGSVISLQVLGAPDFTLISLSEFVEQVNRIGRLAQFPIIVDANHGYGNAINVMRTVNELERTGISALTIEDTLLPIQFNKKFNIIISIEEAFYKIYSAIKARTDTALYIIARININNLIYEDIIERIIAYQSAGADAICICGIKNINHLKKIFIYINIPIILLTYSNTKLSNLILLSKNGVKIIIKKHTVYLESIKAIYNYYIKQRNINKFYFKNIMNKYSILNKYCFWFFEYMSNFKLIK